MPVDFLGLFAVHRVGESTMRLAQRHLGLASRAQNVSGSYRSHIYTAIRARLRTAPLSFFMPVRRAS